MRTITVVNYNPDWALEFEKIKNELEHHIKDFIISIEHVGSTSVPGLFAKPIIDIDIVIEGEMFDKVKDELAKIEYTHIGDLGIKGREAFKHENKQHLMSHNLYVCDKNALELKRHLSLRNFLRENEDYREKYSNIKIEMAKKFPHDIDNYIIGKEPVILEIYEKCGLDISYKNL